MSDQHPSELMDKMLILLPEDEKPGFFFRGLFLDRLPADIRAHLLSEAISDPRWKALCANELWSVHGRSVPVQVLSDQQVEDVYALSRDSSSRTGARGSRTRSMSRSTAVDYSRRSRAASVCWYHRRWGAEANQCLSPCSYLGN